MNVVPLQRYTFMFSVPGGHRYWCDHETGRVAVSDRSGHTPDQTEDGVLWLIEDEPIVAHDQTWLVPVIDPQGRQRHTVASVVEAARLCVEFNMQLMINGVLFAPLTKKEG